MRSLAATLGTCTLLLGLTSPLAAQGRPYTEGPVTSVAYLRIKPGMFDKYMNWLATEWKRNMEAQKKEGIILDYAVYTSPQTREDDWNMLLTTTYKNMAALDNLRDRSEPIATRTLGATAEQLAQGTANRGEMRVQMGSRLLRQLLLK